MPKIELETCGEGEPLTPYRAFCRRWAAGCGSEECVKRRSLVLARGKVPCDVLFVGEAPGEIEDRRGRPFVGPAGQLLDELVARSVKPGLRLAFTNLVCCVPRDGESGKAAEPAFDQIQACKERLEEFVALCRPRVVVCVGQHARKAFEAGYKHSVKVPNLCPECGECVAAVGNALKALFGMGEDRDNYFSCPNGHRPAKPIIPEVIGIVHPAAIMRSSVIDQGLKCQRVEAQLREATEDL